MEWELIMKTGNRTTYILLERGTEDIQLLDELCKITDEIGTRELAEEYPSILGLKQGLEAEKESG
jgi:hypothetical protein